jgi:hypothetical protein
LDYLVIHIGIIYSSIYVRLKAAEDTALNNIMPESRLEKRMKVIAVYYCDYSKLV